MTTTTATIQGGLLSMARTTIDDIEVGALWHSQRDLFPTRIVAVRNVNGGRRITDEYGTSRTYRHGDGVPTAVLIGGGWPA